MIIAIPNQDGILDDLTIKSLKILHIKYPTDAVTIFSTPNLFLFHETGMILCDHDSLPKRITFIGHASLNRYGIYTAFEFANRLKSEINKASQIDPRIQTSIKAIDLLGCETGLSDEKGNSFAQRLANHLFSMKLTIRVSAFTNLSTTNPYPAAASIMYHPDKLLSNPTEHAYAFCFSLLRTETNNQKYYRFIDSKRILYKIQDRKPVKEFYDALKQMKIKWDTEKTSPDQCEQDIIKLGESITQDTYFQSNFQEACTLGLKMIAILFILELNNIVSFFQKEHMISNDPITCVNAVLHHLKLHFEGLDIEIKKCTEKQAALSELVAITDDPRHYFDNTLTCTFIPIQMKARQRPLLQALPHPHSVATSSFSFHNRKKQDPSYRQPINQDAHFTEKLIESSFDLHI